MVNSFIQGALNGATIAMAISIFVVAIPPTGIAIAGIGGALLLGSRR
jgi:hypothetical protein